MTRPACIVIRGTTRCACPCVARAGDLYTCHDHARLLTMAILDEAYTPDVRRRMAYAKWRTVAEGLALLNSARGKAVA